MLNRVFGSLTAIGFGTFLSSKTRQSDKTSSMNSIEPDLPQISLQVDHKKSTRENMITECRHLMTKLQTETRCPGISVAVSVDGITVWSEGFGFSDLENLVPCTEHTVMKVASISKTITSAILGREIESGRIDLDVDVSRYVPNWPQHYWSNEKVSVTTRQLASHLGGIRGYKKKTAPDGSDSGQGFDYEEYYITEKYKNVTQSLGLFKDDPLISRPGSEFFYTNHGYTLLSAVIEGASGKKFTDLLENLFKDLEMENTHIEDHQKITYNLARHYVESDGQITNSPFVESSFKIAGAGLLSSAADLVKFGNVMLLCRQVESGRPGLLKSSTVNLLWTPVENTSMGWDPKGRYGMGWQIVSRDDDLYVGHTGRSVGTSTVLIVHPVVSRHAVGNPSGVVVAILCNMQGINLGPLAVDIASRFDRAQQFL